MRRTTAAFMILLTWFCVESANADTLEAGAAETIAAGFLAARSPGHIVQGSETVTGRDGIDLFHVFHLSPVGFVLVAADTTLPPVIGFSPRNAFPIEGPAFDRVGRTIVADVALRLSQAHKLPQEQLEQRHLSRQKLASGRNEKHSLQLWPPAGSTATGGWVETQWDQGAPYNNDCPTDPVTGNPSVAGCPAVAMAQILDCHRTTNSTRLGDGDDYHHTYAGRNYWIDDDWQAHGFPSFPTLSNSLDALDSRYQTGLGADDAGAAALVFACGVAATQVYSSTASGTFGVNQAVQAYERFAFQGFELLDENDADLYERMERNMKQGRPVHLAVVDSGWTTGHNVVVDGYSSDDTFHLNFGWGGTYDGWYLLPDEMPYGLTVVEGAIVDISTDLFSDGFESGNTSRWSVSAP